MTARTWRAPTARRPLGAAVRMPGSKSVTNRALLLAALADEPTRVEHPLRSRDTELMADALRSLGVGVREEPDAWSVQPAALRGPARVDVGLAGTVMRFVPVLATLAAGDVAFDGDPRARERPMRPLLEALRTLGARIDDDSGGLPFTVRGQGGLRGGAVELDASTSSQLLSALLLAAPRFDHGLQVRHVGGRLPSTPFVELTVAMLRDRGATVEEGSDGTSWAVAPGRLAGGVIAVEPDLSTAGPFLAAALIAGGTVRVEGWPQRTVQAGARTPAVLSAMGAHCELDADGLLVTGTGAVTGIDVDLGDNPELACVLAAVAALASGPSRLRGIAHLRGHETDRLAALARELCALGADVREHEDGLEIRPAPLHGGVFHTYDDHRLAMAAAVLGLVVDGVEVENVETTGKTFPGFPQAWTTMVEGQSR